VWKPWLIELGLLHRADTRRIEIAQRLGMVKYMTLDTQPRTTFRRLQKRLGKPAGVGLIDVDVIEFAVALEGTVTAARSTPLYVGLSLGRIVFARRRPRLPVHPGKLANSILQSVGYCARAAFKLPEYANLKELREANEGLKLLVERIESEIASRDSVPQSASEHNEGN